jgi:hypothetical protein
MVSDDDLFDGVVLRYNPPKRRDLLSIAESLRDQLCRRLPNLPVSLRATRRAGHARVLAREDAATVRGGRP